MLRFASTLTVALFLIPIGAGLIGTLLPAFGYFPTIGGESLSLQPWRDLLAYPGFWTSLRLTLTVGLAATVISLSLAVAICALGQERWWHRRLQQVMTPLLAAPHSAVAIGFAFLLVPSGWLARMGSPWLTGWLRPPDLVTIQDPFGLAFVAGLLIKEVPYLVMMIVGATAQVQVRPVLAVAQSMGYSRSVAWLKLVLPRIYPQIRLPVYAVLAFSLSVVEVGMILAPGNPPPLSVLATRWFANHDLRMYQPAAAAASLQLVIVIVCIALWRLGEVLVTSVGQLWIVRGGRGGSAGPLTAAFGGLAGITVLLGLAGLAGMAIWSVAHAWRFPDALPAQWTWQNWSIQSARIVGPAMATAVIALIAAAAAIVLTTSCLEDEQRSLRRPGRSALWLLYVPLLVPQIAFLFGIQVLLVRLGLDGTWLAVVWLHLVFVLPYVYLSLADPWRRLDARYVRSAISLGASPARVLFAVKLPMLARSILIALAVGFAVSVGQYLPTVFAGAGRIATITTEAVTLAGGADRRVIGIYTFLQAMLPLMVYGGALVATALLYRHRQGLK